LVVDADTPIPNEEAARGNTVKLPCVAGSSGTARSSENTIKKFLRDISKAGDGNLHEALLNLNITNPTSDRIQSDFFEDGAGRSTKRNSTKNWWTKNWPKLKKWEVVERWAEVYQTETAEFGAAFEIAISRTAARVKKADAVS
jgi:hypothetical protein